MLKFHRTSLLDSKAQTIVNTVNTVGVMGKGIAAAFKKKFPDMYEGYKAHCDSGVFLAGTSWLWKGNDQWVLNFATKKHWRNPSRMDYLESGLLEFREKFDDWSIREIAFPRLGCGNGGLKWDDVRPLMVEHLNDLPITVYIHDFEKNIGFPEHSDDGDDDKLPLFASSDPVNFDNFCDDIKRLVERHNGELETFKYAQNFCLSISDEFEISLADKANTVVANKDDLFQIWSQLGHSPVSRFDLPESAYKNAMVIFSTLSQLSYIRTINLADQKGRQQIALEIIDQKPPTDATLSTW